MKQAALLSWALFGVACGSAQGVSPDASTGGAMAGPESGGRAQGAAGGRSAGGSATKPTGGDKANSSGGDEGRTSGGSAGSSGEGDGGSAPGGSTAGGGRASGGQGNVNEDVKLPPENASFDYQIGEAYAPPQGVQVVSRDRESEPATGLYNICYVNGFQTQPQDNDAWLKDHPELILHDAGGDPVIDENWGEYLFDTSTEAKRSELAEIVNSWIGGCASRGFDAIEVDNLDSYSRSGGLLTENDNVAFLRLLADFAHENGLAVGQKNSSEILSRRTEMGTDFAVAEECNRWDECGDYQNAYGDRVYIIEYRKADFDKGCSAYPELSIVLRDLNVSGPGSSSYVYDGC